MHVYQQALNDRVKGDPALLVAADTIIISPGGTIYEKPRSEAHHLSMLQSLRDAPGKRHSVVSAVAVMAPLESARDPGYRMLTAVEETVVVFDKDATDEMLRAYVKTREGADKAGGYGIQGLGGLLIERIEGAWDNVVGLPLRVTLGLIEKCLDQSDEVEEEYEAGMGAEVM
jgi:septum formation protein